MKKKLILLITSIVLGSYLGFSQTTIPNPGFESWEDDKNATDWNSSFNTVVFGVVPVNYQAATKTTDAHSGQYAVKLNRNTVTVYGQPPIYLPGICQLGEFNIDEIQEMVLSGEMDMDMTRMMGGGAPFSEIPLSVKAWIKYQPDSETNDTLLIGVLLLKENEVLGTQIIAQGYYSSGEAINDYTEITISIETLIPEETPEKINIIFSTASGYGCGDASLFVDDVSVNTPSGIVGYGTLPFTIFPNPARNVVNVSLQNDQEFDVEMYDLTGKKVLSQQKQIQTTALNIQHLSAGTYLLKLMQGEKNAIQKIVIE